MNALVLMIDPSVVSSETFVMCLSVSVSVDMKYRRSTI